MTGSRKYHYPPPDGLREEGFDVKTTNWGMVPILFFFFEILSLSVMYSFFSKFCLYQSSTTDTDKIFGKRSTATQLLVPLQVKILCASVVLKHRFVVKPSNYCVCFAIISTNVY